MRTDGKARPTGPASRAKRLKIKQKAVANLEAELLKRVRAREGLSRVDLARQLHLAPSTVGAYVDRLIEEGFLSERQKAVRDFGRPPTLLALNPGGGRFIGVDFEASNLMATAVDFSQQPMRQIHQPLLPTDSVEQVIGKIESVIEELFKDDARTVLGIGVGVPGVIDETRQIVLDYHHIAGWKNIPLAKRLAERFGVPVSLENNIRSMALAEMWFGHGRGVDNFICLGIRTGIAGGAVAGGRLLHGVENLAGEIGHWLCPIAPIQRGAPAELWSCKGLKPLEKIASTRAIVTSVRAGIAAGKSTLLAVKGAAVEFEDVAQAFEAGDELVCSVLGCVAQTLGWVVCQANALLNPQKIIIAGPLVTLGQRFLDPLREAAAEFCAELRQRSPQVEDSALGSFNGALGAAALALHEWKPRR
jgi:N-acetylglucosamine repressor